MRYLKTSVLVALFAAFCAVGAAAQQDTPRQWHETPGRNNVVPARDLPDHIGDENRLWHVELHGRSFFNIITIDGDRVYCGTMALNLPERERSRNGALLCLDLHTGETIWRTILPQRGGYGLSVVPLIEGDRIYQQFGEKAYCLDKETGEILWQESLGGEHFMSYQHGTHTTGLLIGDYWYMATGHCSGSDCEAWVWNSLEAPFYPNIVVLEKETGRRVAQDATPVDEHQHGQWCSLSTGVVDGRRLIFWGDGHGDVHAFAAPEKFEGDEVATLEEVWRCDANPKSYRYLPDGDLFPYVGYQGYLFGPRDAGPCEIISTPVFHDGLLYVALGRDKAYSPNRKGRHIGDGALVCIDPKGEGDITETNKLWTNTDLGRTFCTPSIVGDTIITADHGGYLLGIDRNSGETLWKGDFDVCIWNYFQAVGDGKVYVMNEQRGFHIFSAEDGELLFEAQVDGQNNPQPGLTDGILVVGTTRSIDAYAGPDYLKENKPEQVVESSQIRKGDALNEPLEKTGH
jgi:outer membrane protein assembly factor BamB